MNFLIPDKMTPQKALEIITNAIQTNKMTFEQDNALAITQKALEKQIPKKPKFYDTKFRQRGLKYGEHTTIEKAYNCPNCNCTVWGTDKAKYCSHCGQALDWSDTK